MPRVAIIDYGMCNLGSVRRAFEECGADAMVTEDPADLREASHVVLPGVGAYRDGMANIRERKWDAAIRRAAVEDGIPLLGICLGMQLLSTMGYEGGETEGLGLIPGEVKKLIAPAGERIPHVGWNEVHHQPGDPLFEGILNGMDFYFVHSYHFLASDPAHVSAKTPYCGGLAAAVRAGNVFGVQFHPEKSSLAGFQLLRNFLEYRS
ncbi:MAG: imidazole glycerol phosphate synthase subunit HisH [Fibrobacterota bacterium]|nr:imidazole glycerol phosphate synthase subunit HisH [Fibrobacterota bacterium]